jgi:hypothetical protein
VKFTLGLVPLTAIWEAPAATSFSGRVEVGRRSRGCKDGGGKQGRKDEGKSGEVHCGGVGWGLWVVCVGFGDSRSSMVQVPLFTFIGQVSYFYTCQR